MSVFVYITGLYGDYEPPFVFIVQLLQRGEKTLSEERTIELDAKDTMQKKCSHIHLKAGSPISHSVVDVQITNTDTPLPPFFAFISAQLD